MTKPLDKIAFEYWAGTGSKQDLEAWAEDELKKDTPHPDARELFNLNEETAARMAMQLAEEILNFKPISEQGEMWAKALLHTYCEKLQSEVIIPFEFCRLVTLFDASFVGLRTLEDGSLEYPEWLGDLNNCCDWCDESWSLSNSPDLDEEAKRVTSL